MMNVLYLSQGRRLSDSKEGGEVAALNALPIINLRTQAGLVTVGLESGRS